MLPGIVPFLDLIKLRTILVPLPYPLICDAVLLAPLTIGNSASPASGTGRDQGVDSTPCRYGVVGPPNSQALSEVEILVSEIGCRALTSDRDSFVAWQP